MEESLLSAPEVYVTPIETGVSKKVSNLQSSTKVPIGKTEIVQWESNGTSIEGILILPPSYENGDDPIPLILFLHGGPKWAWNEAFIGQPTMFLWSECLGIYSSAGFAVLAANYRGSLGYGPEFCLASLHDFGGQDYQDGLSGVDAIVERGIADPSRLGIYGLSYGGYLSAFAIGKTDRFKAAVCIAGITNLISFDGTSDINDFFIPGYFGAHPWEEPSFYSERSPVTFLHNINTPLLLQHGSHDSRVPLGQSLELYRWLTFRGAPTELLIYPARPKNLVINGWDVRPLSVLLNRSRLVLDIFGYSIEWCSSAASGKITGRP